jgi:electron transfer flavoprotein beta subunit
VVVVTAAGRPADPVLRDLASLGATVVRVALEDDDAGALAGDERTLADALVEALAPFGRPELVVCGDRSGDRGTGALPAFLAHRWGAAQALGLVGLEAADGHVVAERRLDGGWRERLTVPCPAVCSVEAAGVRLRRASLPSTLRSSAAGIPEKSPTVDLTVQSVGVGALVPFRPRTRVVPGPDGPDPRLRLLALTGVLAEHDPPTVVGPVDAVGAADALFDFFRRHGYPTGAEADHR